MKVKHFLKDHAYQNIPLNYEEAYYLGRYALEGCAGKVIAQIQSIATLSALHTKSTYNWTHQKEDNYHNHRLPKNAAEQIAGVCAAIFQHDIEKSEFGFLKPKVDYAMDNCGMGGDLIVTANVSTIAALIASTAGITMCKHGSPANTDEGRHGSSDFISLIGMNLYAHKHEIERLVEEENFGYTEALDLRYKKIHLQTHEIAMIPHMNDIIGPITNPLDPNILTRRILGVNHLVSPRIVAETYRILNQLGITHLHHGIFVRGLLNKKSNRGMDEISICEGGTQVAELRNNMITEYHLNASDFGIEPVSAELISPPNGMSKGDFSMKILKGEITGPPVQMILANAAPLFYLAGKSQDLKECYKMAEKIYSSGRVSEKIKKLSKKR